MFKTLKKIKAGAFDGYKVTVEGAEYVPVEVILEDYNTSLRSLSDPTLAPFELKEKSCGADCRWYAGRITDDLSLGRQMNFEAPLRNVGDLRGGTDQVFDFASAFEDPNTRSLFRTCREKANATVVKQFQEDANKLLLKTRTALDDPSSIKLQRLKSIMTLYYFYLCTKIKNCRRFTRQKGITGGKAERSRHDEKNAFELLPKVAANDLIRSALSARDKEVLLLTVLSAEKYARFKEAMNSDLEHCVGTLDGILIQEDDPHTVDQCHDMMFVPGTGHATTRVRRRASTALT